MAKDTAWVIKTVKSMLNVTMEHGHTPEEAASASAMVTSLVLKYNLDLEKIAAETDGQQREYVKIEVIIPEKSANWRWRTSIYGDVARNNPCRYIINSGNKNNGWIIGYQENIDVAVYLAHHLVTQVALMAKEGWNQEEYKERYDRKDWILSFCKGATQTISIRLNEAKALFLTSGGNSTSYDTNVSTDESPMPVEEGSNPAMALIVRTESDLRDATDKFFGVNSVRKTKRAPSKTNTVLTGAYIEGQKAGRMVPFTKALPGA